MAEEPIHQGAPRVLLVDDGRETLALLRSVLEYEGIQVVGTATNGAEAMELADRLLPEVVLTDLRMPGLDGLETTRLIKDRHPRMEFIILTFYGDLLPTGSPGDTGAFAYLVKGCSPSLMRDVIFQAHRHVLESGWVEPADRPVAS